MGNYSNGTCLGSGDFHEFLCCPIVQKSSFKHRSLFPKPSLCSIATQSFLNHMWTYVLDNFFFESRKLALVDWVRWKFSSHWKSSSKNVLNRKYGHVTPLKWVPRHNELVISDPSFGLFSDDSLWGKWAGDVELWALLTCLPFNQWAWGPLEYRN